MTLKDRKYHPPYIGEKTETEKSNMSKVTHYIYNYNGDL